MAHEVRLPTRGRTSEEREDDFIPTNTPDDHRVSVQNKGVSSILNFGQSAPKSAESGGNKGNPESRVTVQNKVNSPRLIRSKLTLPSKQDERPKTGRDADNRAAPSHRQDGPTNVFKPSKSIRPHTENTGGGMSGPQAPAPERSVRMTNKERHASEAPSRGDGGVRCAIF